MLKKLLPALCAGAMAVTACAADQGVAPDAQKTVSDALHRLAPAVTIDQIEPAPMAGFYQVIASGQLVYISADGKYLFNGSLVDLNARKDLGDAAWASFRKAELAKIPKAQRIIFAPANPKHTVTVFTDTTCGFCQELHRHIAQLNQQGIAVEYLAWPREGVATTAGRDTKTYTDMVSVWCAADRNQAFSAAIGGAAPKPATCSSPVKQEFELGVKLGVSGTPAVIAEDGSLIGGYLTPEQMEAKLDQLSAKAVPHKS